MSKQHPILFSTEMVQAILEGRKTMTRRILKPQPVKNGMFWEHPGLRPKARRNSGKIWSTHEPDDTWTTLCRYGIGDLLWVRESFKAELVDTATGKPVTYYYLADNPVAANTAIKFKPSIHMPKEAARIWLRIEQISLEKLQDITNEDALREGIEIVAPDSFGFKYKAYDGRTNCLYPRTSFFTLWESIFGTESFGLNPWVWVVSFKVLSTTGKPI